MSNDVFLPGCGYKYVTKSPTVKPEDGETLGPWVQIKLIDGGKEITVSNQSSPPDNTVVIKDFEFGMSDGATCVVVLHDQAGSSLAYFMQNLVKNFADLKPFAASKMEVQWGWIKAGCSSPLPDNKTPYIHLITMDSVEQSFAQGKFTYHITGKGIAARAVESRSEKVRGDEKNLKRLKKAIEELWTDDCEKPAITSVRFVTYDKGGGEPRDIGFRQDHTGSKEGPLSVWVPEGKGKLQTTREWISRWPSENNKGWLTVEDTRKSGGGTLLIVEDGKPETNTPDWDSMSLGTYVINGGKYSPVIEFNPKFRWDFVSLVNASGAMGDIKPMQNPKEAGKTKGHPYANDLKREECKNHDAGISKTNVPDESLRRQGGKDQQEQADQAQGKDALAAKVYHDQINADLVVVGDPTLPTPYQGMWARNLSTVFINPFHILGAGGDGCGEWLADPPCNEVLSNKAWLIKSITHKIQAGRYTTTISIYLCTPGIDIPLKSPIGGAGSMGWSPA